MLQHLESQKQKQDDSARAWQRLTFQPLCSRTPPGAKQASLAPVDLADRAPANGELSLSWTLPWQAARTRARYLQPALRRMLDRHATWNGQIWASSGTGPCCGGFRNIPREIPPFQALNPNLAGISPASQTGEAPRSSPVAASASSFVACPAADTPQPPVRHHA